MDKTTISDCPFCANSDVVVLEQTSPRALAVQCRECGVTGPRCLSSDPAHAVFAWNQRMGRMSLIK
jgi:hypothetical protein